jgi:hypothetical protein
VLNNLVSIDGGFGAGSIVISPSSFGRFTGEEGAYAGDFEGGDSGLKTGDEGL